MSTIAAKGAEPVATGPVPASKWIRLDDGAPHVVGQRCTACSAVFTRTHRACPRCCSGDSMESFRASERGEIASYSVVVRSFPGVVVPFISSIVELSDGVVLKGVLRGVKPHPDAIANRMPVRVVFAEVEGQKDASGNPYVAYHFEPEEA